jgi:hypothetical protein
MVDPQQHHLVMAGNGAVHGAHELPGVSQPLQLTQLLGSEGDHNVLLEQPKANIIARAKMPRGDRLVRSTAGGGGKGALDQ